MVFQKGHKLGNFGNGFKKGVVHKTSSLPRTPEVKAKISATKRAKYGYKGESDHSERIRFQREVQPKIFKRDNYTCQICEQYNGMLHVDHIKRWVDYPELRFDMNNCRTLCMACHYYITFKRRMPNGIIWGNNLNRRAN